MMKKLRWLVLIIAPLAVAARLLAGTYNPGFFPLRYNSGETNADVITTASSLLVGCEIANGSASAQSYIFYDARSIPADGFLTQCTATSTHPCYVGYVYKCAAATTCYWNPPDAISINGGMGIPMALGIAWSNSSTFPNKTIGSRDSVVTCSYSVYNNGPLPPVSTPTATPSQAPPTSTPFPM